MTNSEKIKFQSYLRYIKDGDIYGYYRNFLTLRYKHYILYKKALHAKKYLTLPQYSLEIDEHMWNFTLKSKYKIKIVSSKL